MERKSNFVKEATILAGAGILSRIIGFAYRVPLTNMIGDGGIAIYGMGYNLYNLFLIMSSAGLPVAISKMVAERHTVGRYADGHRVFRASMALSASVGFFFMLIMLFGARFFASLMNAPEIYYTVITLAPTVFLVAIMAVFRGYFQGMQTMLPTAASQVIEQIFNAVFSVVLAFAFLQGHRITAGATSETAIGGITGNLFESGAAGGTAGTGIGAAAGLIFVAVFYLFARKPIMERVNAKTDLNGEKTGGRAIAIELLKTAFPIILGTAIFSFTNLIDAAMIMDRLESAVGFSHDEAFVLYGQLNGKFVTLTTLLIQISTSLAIAAIPSIASSIKSKDHMLARNKINTSLRISMMITMPGTVGLGILANQILALLFPAFPGGGGLLQIGSVSVIFLALYQISTGMLQATSNLKIPVVSAAVGVAVKIILNYTLVGIPELNIKGAVISTVACYLAASAVNLFFLRRRIKIRFDLAGIFIKPLAASAVMGLCCYLLYNLMASAGKGNAVSLAVTLFASVLVYFFALIMVRGLDRDDLRLFPMGGKVCKALEKLRLL